MRADGTIIEVMSDGRERPLPDMPMRAMTEAEIEAAAAADPDARPMTPEELRTARRVPRVKTDDHQSRGRSISPTRAAAATSYTARAASTAASPSTRRTEPSAGVDTRTGTYSDASSQRAVNVAVP